MVDVCGVWVYESEFVGGSKEELEMSWVLEARWPCSKHSDGG